MPQREHVESVDECKSIRVSECAWVSMKGCRGECGGRCESMTVNVFGECEQVVVRMGVKVRASFSRQDRTCVHEGDVYSCPRCSLWNPCGMQNPHRTCWNSRLVWPSRMSLLRALRLSAWTAPLGVHYTQLLAFLTCQTPRAGRAGDGSLFLTLPQPPAQGLTHPDIGM